jgi:1-acyl-sn-glycerol-3-phosphate acyltransferase
VICNHQSWADILILNWAFNRRIAVLKFFMKKELIWQLPLVGLACKALGFPFLSRHSRQAIKKNPALKGKDAQSTQDACDYVKRHPASLMIFPEGSRFRLSKQEKQGKAFEYLLKPKAGGFAMAINGVGDALAGVLDVTIDYGPHQGSLSFLKFLSGAYPHITVGAESVAITPDLLGNYQDDVDYKKHIQQWLTDKWQQKDKQLTKAQG